MVLFLRTLRENLRRPGSSDDEYERVTKSNLGFLESFYLNAEAGDERSVRIVAALENSR